MILPDIETIKKIIKEWVENYPRIVKVYLFGSYVKKNKPVPSDIDIAIEISEDESDTAFGLWCSEGSKMEKDLSSILSYPVDLEWFDKQETPTVRKGLEESNILIYEKPTSS